MGMNDTPASERVHIAFFGCRNAGKSSLINAVTGQQVSVVSPVPGTTTDAVHKSMELLPAGPVMITDTPGLDDEGALGQLRIAAAQKVLRTADIAVLVIDGLAGATPADEAIKALVTARDIPFVPVFSKADLLPAGLRQPDRLYVSSVTGEGISELKETLAGIAKSRSPEKAIAGDLVKKDDFVVLVVPIDASAPRGRLILPQQQVIRDLLNRGAVPVVTKDTELKGVLDRLGNRIALVITDSQVFGSVSKTVPQTIPLTSFSILFSRYKGELAEQLKGLEALKSLRDGDRVLISEGCTHHRQCGDIGTVKIPAMLRACTGKDLRIETASGKDFPEDLSRFRVIIHCGGCMLTEAEMKERIRTAKAQGVPITNYGMVLAFGSGILGRSLEPLGITL